MKCLTERRTFNVARRMRSVNITPQAEEAVKNVCKRFRRPGYGITRMR